MPDAYKSQGPDVGGGRDRQRRPGETEFGPPCLAYYKYLITSLHSPGWLKK